MNEEVKRYRIMPDPIAAVKDWPRTDPAIIESKYRYKKMMKDLNIPFKPIDKNKIRWHNKENLFMNGSFTITEKYNNFNGRIITNESVIYNENKEEKICVEWDSGATRGSISEELVNRLNLKPCGTSATTSTIGEITTNVYEIILVLHDVMEIPLIVDAVPNIHSTGIDMLIGMDVIH